MIIFGDQTIDIKDIAEIDKKNKLLKNKYGEF